MLEQLGMTGHGIRAFFLPSPRVNLSNLVSAAAASELAELVSHSLLVEKYVTRCLRGSGLGGHVPPSKSHVRPTSIHALSVASGQTKVNSPSSLLISISCTPYECS